MVKRSQLKVNDKKWREIKKRIPEVKGAEVRVGVLSGAGASDSGAPLVMVAVYNEFGTNGGGWGGPIPARPFLGTASDENIGKWGEAADSAIDKALTLKASFKSGLSKLGILASGDVQKKITSIDSPPNSEVTVALKGSSNPLIDNDNLRGAISYEVKP